MSGRFICSASWLINPDASPIPGGALLVDNGMIADCGTLQTLRGRHSVPVVDYPGCVLLPGFINAHTHLELTHFPSWLLRSSPGYHPRRFTDWVIQLIKITRSLSPDVYPASIREGARLCLESGTTALGEIVTRPFNLAHYFDIFPGGRLYFEVLGQETRHFSGMLEGALTSAEACRSREVAAGLSPHSPYTVGKDHFAVIRDAARSHALPLSIHLAESASEADFVTDGSGLFASEFYPFVGWERFLGNPSRCSSAELLDSHGLLTPTTLAVHCVHVSEGDVGIIKRRGAAIALCPRSNDTLDVGRAPVALFKKYAVPLALGTDSLASNNSLSLWDEIRFALDNYNGALTAQDLLKMATSGGASALGHSALCGELKSGLRADFQVVEIQDSGAVVQLERVLRESRVRDVYLAGVPYNGGAAGGTD